jgi:hypothetical protein
MVDYHKVIINKSAFFDDLVEANLAIGLLLIAFCTDPAANLQCV